VSSPLGPDELRRWLDEAAAGPTAAVFDDVFRRAERHRRAWRAGLVAATVAVVAAVVVVATLPDSGGSARQKVIASPAPPPPLPSTTPSTGMRPATLAELVGHWRSINPSARQRSGSVNFDYRGRWAGSDGCNISSGRFQLGAGGLFDIRQSFSTDVKCPARTLAPEVRLVRSAQYAWVQGDQLILLNSTGTIIGRLERYDTAGFDEAGSGTVIGTFKRAGGPVGAAGVPLAGTIEAHSNSRSGRARGFAANSGRFRFSLPPGRYYFDGISPQINSGRLPGCPLPAPRTVVAGQTIHLTITCQIR
jgi:heat shock protein HslJ